MFDNLLFQQAATLISSDIKNSRIPSSILLSGPEYSGKLTCALEIARVISCSGNESGEKGNWFCNCPSCKKNRELLSQNIILTGPKICSLEILAARQTLLSAGLNNSAYMDAARFLFLRAVRKLTLRFNPFLWEGNKKLSKIAPLLEEINDCMEELNPSLPLVENDRLDKITSIIAENSIKLESSFLYDSIPINQILKANSLARLKTADGKKVLIIENADRMNESCRNALLKILEEPPEDSLFILTTSRRGAVMPTILSRLRTYTLNQRTQIQESQVIDRVFHENPLKYENSLKNYLYSFLTLPGEQIRFQAKKYYDGILNGKLLSMQEISDNCNSFEPRALLTIFLEGVIEAQKCTDNFEMSSENVACIGECFNNITIFNIRPVAALEKLYRDLSAIRKKYLR